MRKTAEKLMLIKIVALMMPFGYGPLSWADTYQAYPSEGEIRFEVESTLHRVEGAARKWFGSVDFDPNTGNAATPFEIHVLVQSLDTGNQGRDKAMMRMFDTESYPEAIWKITEWQCPGFNPEKGGKCLASGNFLIHGWTAQKKAEVNLRPIREGFYAWSEIALKTDDFGLKPPSVLGIIRVAKQVKISVSTNWKKQ